MNYTHFRFGVACHDLNGFWYSPHLMTCEKKSDLSKLWKVWKKAEKEIPQKKDDPREMLIDQYDENGDLGNTIIIPSQFADRVQRTIFKDQYEELKFDIFSEDVKPETVAELKERLFEAGVPVDM